MSAEEAWQVKKPRYNAWQCGHGKHKSKIKMDYWLNILLTIVVLPFLVVIGAALVAFFIYLVVTIYNGIKDFFYWL